MTYYHHHQSSLFIIYTAVYFRQLTSRDKLADWGLRFGGKSRRQEFLSVLGRGVWPLGANWSEFSELKGYKRTAGKVLILLEESSKTDFPTTKNMGCLITSLEKKKQMLVSWTPRNLLPSCFGLGVGIGVWCWCATLEVWLSILSSFSSSLGASFTGWSGLHNPTLGGGLTGQKGVGKEKRHPGIFLKKTV